MKRSQILTNKPVYLGLSILDLSKTVMCEFWYDCLKPKCSENVKLCYMDTGSFIVHVKTDDIYKDIAKDIEKRFDTLNYEIDRPLPKGQSETVIGLMKDELGGKIIKEFVGLRKKKTKKKKKKKTNIKNRQGIKKCIVKIELKFQDYKNCLNAAKIDVKLKYLENKKI